MKKNFLNTKLTSKICGLVSHRVFFLNGTLDFEKTTYTLNN